MPSTVPHFGYAILAYTYKGFLVLLSQHHNFGIRDKWNPTQAHTPQHTKRPRQYTTTWAHFLLTTYLS